jgi:hypothetical protein
MAKKRLLVALALLTAVGLTAFVVHHLQPLHFTPAMADCIHPGMTEAEVVEILRKEAGDYQTRENYLPVPDDYRSNVWLTPEGLRHPDGTYEKAWVSDEGGVAVEFDSDGRVGRAYFDGPYWTDERSPLDFFRCLFRWAMGCKSGQRGA